GTIWKDTVPDLQLLVQTPTGQFLGSQMTLNFAGAPPSQGAAGNPQIYQPQQQAYAGQRPNLQGSQQAYIQLGQSRDHMQTLSERGELDLSGIECDPEGGKFFIRASNGVTITEDSKPNFMRSSDIYRVFLRILATCSERDVTVNYSV
ncbi:hypothetical protein FOZ63_007603, partial [Perkinsus olseni]